jgi:photosystem II stability/assembly factor-like uncharacterized protein
MRQAVTLLCALLFLTGMVFAADGGKDKASVFPEVQNTAPLSVLSGWNQVPLELATTNYVSLDYLPSGVIWIVGYSASGTTTENYGYRSTDNGTNWTRFTVTPLQATRPGICNIAVRDANTALVGYFTGEILRTTNGGVNWDTVYSYGDKTQYINGIKFVGSNVAIAVGDADASGCMVARSTDAGATWTRETGFPTDADSVTTAFYWAGYATLGACMDVVGSTVWTTWYFGSTQQPLIMKSTDAGVTWSKWRADLASLATNYYYRSVNFADQNLGYASTRGDGTTDTYIYYKTTDGGLTWAKQPEMETGLPHAQQRVYSVKGIRGTNVVVGTGFSTATGAKTWWSTDNGTTFVPYYAPGASSLVNSAFLTPTQGFAIGGKMVLQYTSTFPVTFRVNMKVAIKQGTFNKATDYVTIRGSMNNWGNTANTDTLKPLAAPNDSTYSITEVLASTGQVDYKFWASPVMLSYENIPSNRSYLVGAGGGLVPTVWFSNDSIVNPPASVTFQVNMRVKFLEKTFGKDSTVLVRGSFNNWGDPPQNKPDTMHALTAPNDSIYAVTKNLVSGDKATYKFWAKGLGYEVNNRTDSILVGSQTIPAVLFDNDSVINVPVSTQIFWATNVRTYIQLGWFDPIKDSVGVQGDFTSWSNSPVPQDLTNPEVYGDIRPYNGTVGDIKQYKFFMKRDSATAYARWGAYYNGNKDGFNYEHPPELGDGNNKYTVINAPNQTANLQFFSSIAPSGALMAKDSVNVTFTVNMGPAKHYSDPFVPATDTVYVHFRDALWVGSQKASQGSSFPERKKMTQMGGTGGDSMYTLTMKVKGPTHYNVMYTYQYYHPGGGNVDIGGGLGATYQFITRFIRTATPGTWPAAYSFPQDTWKDAIPLAHETVQFPAGVEEPVVATTPLRYSLEQNYPNPFNPSTQIKYSLPEATKVTLKVFNILGQEVSTLVNEVRPAGSYVSLFEGHNLATGVYFYRLEAGKFSQVKKMLLLK